MYSDIIHTHFFSKLKICFYLMLINSSLFFSQIDTNTSITFNFNKHSFIELNNLVKPKYSNAVLVEDRFGNAESAVSINGNINSYLNLGTSRLLKPKTVTFSLWVNIGRALFYGKGYRANPILLLKNSPGDDFNIAYAIFYQLDEKRFNAVSTQDSTKVAQLNSVNKVVFNRWYHLVLTSDYNYLSFYVDGRLQGRSIKKFETTFLDSDSLMIGHTANKKNERFTVGVFDDIQIFHRVLNEKEIEELYYSNNPNKSLVLIKIILKIAAFACCIFLIAFLMVWQRRRSLQRVKDKLDTNRQLHEMEIRTLKAQMNPHFIFNSLNSIQQLVMTRENDKAEVYLSKFSKLIRDLLESNANESLLLAEEIRIIKGYIEMEMLRFDAAFSYSVYVDDKLNPEQIKLPHLMIQPFIENAIWHGLLTKQGSGFIDIRFDYDSDVTIKCSIDDNGIGREASKKNESTFKRRSLALSIVKQRLELMGLTLKVACKVDIIDKMNQQGQACGTRVEIILPILKK